MPCVKVPSCSGDTLQRLEAREHHVGTGWPYQSNRLWALRRKHMAWQHYKHLLWKFGIHGTGGIASLLVSNDEVANTLKLLLDKMYGHAVDWWSFGILIYQMNFRQSPFRGEDEDGIYDAILTDDPLYPIHSPQRTVDICQSLLQKEPNQRLGSGSTDAQEVMNHPYFLGINWYDLYHKRVPVPYKPTISNEADTSNFDPEYTHVTSALTPVQSG